MADDMADFSAHKWDDMGSGLFDAQIPPAPEFVGPRIPIAVRVQRLAYQSPVVGEVLAKLGLKARGLQ